MSSLSESEEEEILLWTLTLKRRKSRRIWVHEINEKRKKLGENLLCKELESHEDRFYTYFRMSPGSFEDLHNLLKPHITKQNTRFREAISSRERLALTLRFLTTGDCYKTLSFSYRIGNSTVSKIVTEVCQEIWNVLQPLAIPQPTQEMWLNIAEDFFGKWGFPHCLGSVDGKHITIKCPPDSGSMFYCYKSKFSIVLLAVVDANYKFIYVDIGSFGKDSDSTIFEKTPFLQLLRTGQLNVPNAQPLQQGTDPLPYVLIGDGAFKLETFLMRPFVREAAMQDRDKKRFNQALSRARVVVECAFGIMAQKFRIFLRPFETDLTNTIKIVKAACCLHNFIQTKESAVHTSSSFEIEQLGAFLPQNRPGNRQRASSAAFEVRGKFVQYFTQTQRT
ncbi:uncharacterized protein [Maniola hyperantus]|uniref:uncharacterized protein n=1 Tax=Aphantopus hyperantus TaxID=2795564 RepID=UPI00374861C0